MPLRIIAKLLGRRRDQGHDRAEQLLRGFDQIARSIEKSGGQPMDMQSIREIATKTAAQPPTELTEESVARYLSALSETERTMFMKCRDGMLASEIAKNMNMERLTVARTLAKIYADLRFLNHRSQPTKEACSA